MHRQLRLYTIVVLILEVAVHVLSASEPPVALPEFRVEGTPWRYAKVGDLEILSRASAGRARHMATALVRGKRLFPDFFTQGRSLPLLLIVADSPRRTVSSLKPSVLTESDVRQWPVGYQSVRDGYELADEETAVFAINLGNLDHLWPVLSYWGKQAVRAQRPAFAEWVTTGLFDLAGPLSGVIGIPRTTTIRFPRLSWPDAAVAPGEFPQDAAEFPVFAVMFDPARHADGLSPAEKAKFQFQTALFARWSLFGPVTNGRNRNGYWAFAEMTRRDGATEALFRECYGMDWAQACVEMCAYLKRRNVGLLEVRMPHVMADVPEVERMEFRDATSGEAKRILGEFNRLRAAQTECEKVAKALGAMTPVGP